MLFAVVLSVLLMVIGVPIFISFSLGASLFLLNSIGFPLSNIGQLLFAGIDKYVFLAIPLFIMAGSLMVYGGCSQPMVRVVDAFIGHHKGGLSLSVIGSSAMYSTITGSNAACAAAVGGMLIPEMKKSGYSGSYSAALTAGAASMGNLIPPSLTAIVYCGVVETSVAKQFLGGVVPGLMIGVLMCVASIWISRRRGYGGGARLSWGERGHALAHAMPALLMPVIILGGIYTGVFTATEAAAIACGYAILVGFLVYRKLNLSTLWQAIIEGAQQTANIYLLVASVILLSSFFTLSGLTQTLGAWVAGLNVGPVGFLLVAAVMLFVLGMVIEAAPLILLSIPVFMPGIQSLGISPILFGTLLALVVGVGLITPPVALVLYVATGICGEPIDKVIKEVTPFLGIQVLVTVLVIVFPVLATGLPGLLMGK